MITYMIDMLGVVINYCSNESMFIESILKECSKFSKDIIVSYGSHTYDGVPEKMDIAVQDYPHVDFVEYQVDLSRTGLTGVVKRPTAYWCNLARWQGIVRLKERKHVEYVLFIDADEVPEGDKVNAWLANTVLNPQTVYKLANYWYFKSPENQATEHEDSILIAPIGLLTETKVFHDDERDSIFRFCGEFKQRMIKGLGGTPMFHHYSWVRGREGLLKKMQTWAHRDDIFKGIDAENIIQYIYRNNDVNDVVHNYLYNKVIPPWKF